MGSRIQCSCLRVETIKTNLIKWLTVLYISTKIEQTYGKHTCKAYDPICVKEKSKSDICGIYSWTSYNMDLKKILIKTPHSSHFSVSYGVSFMSSKPNLYPTFDSMSYVMSVIIDIASEILSVFGLNTAVTKMCGFWSTLHCNKKCSGGNT